MQARAFLCDQPLGMSTSGCDGRFESDSAAPYVADTLRCVAWSVRPKGAAGPAVCEVYLLTFSYSNAARSDVRLLGMQLLQARFLCSPVGKTRGEVALLKPRHCCTPALTRPAHPALTAS